VPPSEASDSLEDIPDPPIHELANVVPCRVLFSETEPHDENIYLDRLSPLGAEATNTLATQIIQQKPNFNLDTHFSLPSLYPIRNTHKSMSRHAMAAMVPEIATHRRQQ
jgi:hypothetical protein